MHTTRYVGVLLPWDSWVGIAAAVAGNSCPHFVPAKIQSITRADVDVLVTLKYVLCNQQCILT